MITAMIGICSEDQEFSLLVAHILKVEGYDSKLATSIDDALSGDGTSSLRALLLDCRSDNSTASDYASRKKDGRLGTMPAMAFIASGAESQRFDVLRSGVEACLVRPLVPAQLLSFLRTTLNPRSSPAGSATSFLEFEDLEMHLHARRVFRNGQEVFLGPIEFRLLQHLLENQNVVASRQNLIDSAWPSNVYVGERTVDVHMSRLRKALSQYSRVQLIRTVRLVGYVLQRFDIAAN